MLPVLHGGSSLSPFGSTPFNRLESFFDRFFNDLGEPLARPNGSWSPMPVAIWSDENNLYIEAEVPGVTEKDVEVTVHGDVLSIRAVREEPAGRRYAHNGRVFGRFERAMALPEAVDTDRIDATVVNGVLSLTLPKKADARPKKISIKGA
ncbi:MAG: Hsp20/alpha crystallin family protein [Isosphaeraceae bacterium]